MSKRFARDTRDVGPGPIYAMLGLLAFIALSAVVLKWFRGHLLARLERADSDRPVAYSVLPPEPRLQANPAGDLARMRAEETAELEGWGWYDKKAGLARVPVERAMAALAEQPQHGRTSP